MHAIIMEVYVYVFVCDGCHVLAIDGHAVCYKTFLLSYQMMAKSLCSLKISAKFDVGGLIWRWEGGERQKLCLCL